MKTKIIYISGNEVFDMADIRAAFDEVRNTLNLDKNTVLFGVPVDNDDAGLIKTNVAQPNTDEQVIQQDFIEEPAPVEETQTTIEVIDEIVEDDLIPEPEPVLEKPVKKRGRSRKAKIEPVIEDSDSTNDVDDKVVPILSVLSSKEDTDVVKEINDDVDVSDDNDIEIIEDIVQETKNNVEPDTSTDEVIAQDEESDDDNEPDLEKLLSAMKPLQEDTLSDTMQSDMSEKETDGDDEDNIDATLEQLATEFVQTQDKIASESKSSGRGRIGKLRNILPFKQSKHKDQGLGDLFGWAGVAANDEDFSVPGFFTNASSKK